MKPCDRSWEVTSRQTERLRSFVAEGAPQDGRCFALLLNGMDDAELRSKLTPLQSKECGTASDHLSMGTLQGRKQGQHH